MFQSPLDRGFASAIDALQALPNDQMSHARDRVRPALRPGIELETERWDEVPEVCQRIRDVIHRLLSEADICLQGNNLRQKNPQRVTRADGDQILELYERTGLASENSALIQSLKITGAFAEGIGEACVGDRRWSQRERKTLHPQALRAMGFLRNIGTTVASKHIKVIGYYSRKVLTHILCEKLGVHETFKKYLLPLWMHLGPLSSDQYEHFPMQHSQRIIERYCSGVYKSLTNVQGILEFSGVLPKVDEKGHLRTLEEILRDLHPGHSTGKAAKQKWGETPWLIDADADDRLHRPFSEGWGHHYEQMNEVFGPELIDGLRQKFQAQLDRGEL